MKKTDTYSNHIFESRLHQFISFVSLNIYIYIYIYIYILFKSHRSVVGQVTTVTVLQQFKCQKT